LNARTDELKGVLSATEKRLTDLSRQLDAQEGLVDAVSRDMQGRLDAVAKALKVQDGRADSLSGEVQQVRHRLAARLSLAADAYGTLGDLDKPMGYAFDAADLDGSGKQPATLDDIFGASEEVVRQRQQAYVPFFKGLDRIVDLGC